MRQKPYFLTCLYKSTAPQFTFDQIVKLVSEDLRLSDLEPQIITQLTGRLLSFDMGGQFSIQITIRNETFDPDVLGIALWGSKSTTIENDFVSLIQDHESFIKIIAEPEEGLLESLELRQKRLYTMQLIMQYLNTLEKPLLVYSSLAQSLMLPPVFNKDSQGKLNSLIFEQAVLSSRGGKIGSGAPIGSKVKGAEELIGMPVKFTEVPFPSWALTQGATDFFAYVDENGVPKDGTEFKGREGRELYAVKHIAPTESLRLGRLEITIKLNAMADQYDMRGNPVYPELLAPETVDKQATWKVFETERHPLVSIAILLGAIIIAVWVASLVKS